MLFVVALCRFQHHSLPLASIHYATWSVVHVALHAIAFSLFGLAGPVVLGVAVAAWAIRMDQRVGLLFGLMECGYAWAAIALVPVVGTSSSGATIGLALGAIVGAIVVEAASHVLVQGFPPRPPARAMASLPARQKGAFVPYFVVTFGLFFLTLDLAMRLLGYRQDLHRRANAIAGEWHDDALRGAADGSREMHLHQRAIVELSS